MFSVGLTGGIGSGKSTVARRFESLGAGIVDSDAIAHAITATGGAAIEPIRAAFGPQVIAPGGHLDRDAMRARVFADPHERKRLEAIVHPLIRARVDEAARALTDAPYIVFVVPLLVESGTWRDRVDRVLVVDCDEATQIARVVARSGLAVKQIRAILAAQATREQRLQAADDVLDNSSDESGLVAAVAALDARYRALANDQARR